ncbi:DUF4259 domain-containing protein [Streptomyces sp. NPDC058247]|uniref:DUF4259 domain-containing protein n=1 Tax=Streptomyces sp. NPDC058247 TaxID=3346401 RepID=UPI0036EFD28D
MRRMVSSRLPCGAPQARVAMGSQLVRCRPRLCSRSSLLAVEALGRVVAEASELVELWDETADGPNWRQSISCIRAVLAPGPVPQEDPLCDVCTAGAGRMSVVDSVLCGRAGGCGWCAWLRRAACCPRRGACGLTCGWRV